ncbi:MAG: hypothetical protein EBS55_08735 [Flavobacteriaceae bacterium]|nr:hypothetical protein [Flavobacteriaceae bacterium]
MANNKINYTDRDFESLRDGLINYTKQYYPELVQNFNDASVFSVLMDLNAAVADNLHYHIDRSIQETVLQYAQQKSSIYNIARTYGLKIPGYRPSVAVVDVSITVPPLGDAEDFRYLGILRAGSQFNGGGTSFETVYDIDFSTQYNQEGFVNRTKIPTFDNNNKIINYVITKREVVVNGTTKVFKRVINPSDVVPFFNFFLPERNVLGVNAIIQKDGTNYPNVPNYTEFVTSTNKWYEVDALAEDTVFIEDPTKPTDQAGNKVGKYIKTDNRFITEYTSEGFMKVQFGAGTTTPNIQLANFAKNGINLDLANYQNNIGLGLTVQPNTTIFVQYRTGGGLASNVGVGVINQIGTIDFAVTGPSDTINSNVVNSLTISNVTAAIGGANPPSTEEVRNMVAFNFAAQKRAVTVNDYKSLIDTMPGKFGAPAKVAITENNNKITIQILSYDQNGKLTQTVSNVLKSNLATYLSKYRMINDYISIDVAKVIDLSFEIYIVLESNVNRGQVITEVINQISNYMAPENRELGENVNVSDVRRLIQNTSGVLTLSDLKVFNMVGGLYSTSETSQRYVDKATKQIQLIDDTIYAEPTQVYQVRFDNKDIKVYVKNLSSVDFS